MTRIVRRGWAVLVGAFALLASTAAQAALTWQVDVLPDGVMYPADVAFDGRRTVNAFGVSMLDVNLGTLPGAELIQPIAINDLGQVISNVHMREGDFVYVKPGISNGGVLTLLSNSRGSVQAINNNGEVVMNLFGVEPRLWPGPNLPLTFDPVAYPYLFALSFFDINDHSQILASVAYDQVPHTGEPVIRYAVLSPVPEPAGYIGVGGALCVLGVVWRRGRPLRRPTPR